MTPARGRPRRIAGKQGYHHLDLRRALLDAALNHLATGDVATLTMQALAREAGVSPGAPYHHFADKLALLAALAEEGWTRWHATAERAIAGAGGPRDALAAMAHAWIGFTRRNPAHHRVMLLPELGDRVRFATMHAASGAGLALLLRLVAEACPRLDPAERAGRAVALWSTLHGFALLAATGVLTNIPGLPALAAMQAVMVERAVAAAVE